MTVASATPEACDSEVPETGQLVRVRGQQWVVTDVKRSHQPQDELAASRIPGRTLVALASVSDDDLGEELTVVWEIEPGRQVVPPTQLPAVTAEGFDDPQTLGAFLDAVRWGTVASADTRTLQAPFRSGITIEEYQLEPVARALSMPRVNLLIADDVGLGKTIEAGLVVQEMLLRHRARRVVVVCPASLTLKWREEMASKFGLDFQVLDTAKLRELRRTHGLEANPFAVYPRTIISLQWLRTPRVQRMLDEVLTPDTRFPGFFDLMIVDEAHHVAPAAPATTIRDIEYKARLLADAEKLSGTIKLAADALVACGLANAKLKGKKQDAEFLSLYFSVANNNTERLTEYVATNLQKDRPAGTVERDPLHWPLAFPEIFADTTNPGFDAIIGNPPFLGGKKVSGTLGDDYLAWVQHWDGRGNKGNVDLAARFVLRTERLLSERGQVGLVTTNTLIEGDTLEVGMAQIALVVRAARSPHPWPTKSASLQIVEVWASRTKLSRSAAHWLDGEEVPAIGPDLEPYGRVRGRPYRLRENEDSAFIGSYVLGSGFTMSHEQAQELIARNQRNAEVLQPYVIGKDLNQRSDCSASRWIINFRDWPLERAHAYPDCLDIVERLVKPERERKKAPDYRRYWWRYGRRGAALYEKIKDLDRTLVISLVGNVLLPVQVPTGPVFAHACGVFAFNDFASLAVLSSNIHSTWVIRYTSTMRTDIRYAPSDVFLTLPRPHPTPELEQLGRQLHETRRDLMLARAWGLTKTYNRVHDQDNHEPEIVELRDIHVAIDEAVMRAYGWDDLDLKIGHHPTKIGIRWTVSKEARFELLDRLLEENHRRYAIEQGLQ